MLKKEDSECAVADIYIQGMTCAVCVGTIQNHLTKSLAGVTNASVNLVMERAKISFQPDIVNPDTICREIDDLGFETSLISCSNFVTVEKRRKSSDVRTLTSTSTTDTTPQSNSPFLFSTPIQIDDDSKCSLPKTIQSKTITKESTHMLHLRIKPLNFEKSFMFWPFNRNKQFSGAMCKDNISQAMMTLRRMSGVLNCINRKNGGNQKSLTIIYNPHMVGARTLLESAISCMPNSNLIPVNEDLVLENIYANYQTIARHFSYCAMPATIVGVLAMTPHHSLPTLLQNEIYPGLSFCATLMFLLTTPIHFLAGWKFHRQAYMGLRRGCVTMDLLVSISTNLTYGYSVLFLLYSVLASVDKSNSSNESVAGSPHFFETSAIVITIMLLGQTIESRVRLLSAQAICRMRDTDGEESRVLLQGTTAPPLKIADDEEDTDVVNLLPKKSIRGFGKSSSTISGALIEIGDLLIVKQGGVVPADGVQEVSFVGFLYLQSEGPIYIDESVVTGESIPLLKYRGDKIIGGSRLVSGDLKLKVTEVGSQTFLGQIQVIVEAANTAKSSSQIFADRLAQYFIPAVLAVALFTAIVWTIVVYAAPSWGHDMHHGTTHSKLIFVSQFAISVIAIACPCALGLATPTAIALATGRAAHFGIIIKNADAIEQSNLKIDDFVIDKTGTLTRGLFKLNAVTFTPLCNYSGFTIHHRPYQDSRSTLWGRAVATAVHINKIEVIPMYGQAPSRSEAVEAMALLFWLTGSAQLKSDHPIGKAIVNFCRQELETRHLSSLESFPPLTAPHSFMTFPGEGIFAEIDILPWTRLLGGGSLLANTIVRVSAGNMKLTERFVSHPPESNTLSNQTSVFITMNGKIIGELGFGDVLKEDVIETVERLRVRYHNAEVWMCTGDTFEPSRFVGDLVGIDKAHIRAGMSPIEKAGFVKELQSQGRRVMMLGDGVNDAAALSAATIGVVVGTRSDLTVAAGDVLLIGPNIGDALTFLAISRATVKTIKRNYLWAFLFNGIGLPAAAGLFYPRISLPPTIAGSIMGLSSVVVICNSLLLAWFVPEKISKLSANDETTKILELHKR